MRSVVLVLVLFISVHASDLEERYYPTKAEWLELNLSKYIHEFVEWSYTVPLNVRTSILLHEGSYYAVVCMGTRYDVVPLPGSQKDAYIKDVKTVAQGYLENTTWAKDVETIVLWGCTIDELEKALSG